MEIINIRNEVILFPNELGNDIYENINKRLKSKEGFCDKKYGCYVRFISLNEIIEAKIDFNDCSINFLIDYTFEMFKPKINVKYFAVVDMIYPEGSLIKVLNFESVSALILNEQLPIGKRINVTLKEISFNNIYQCVAEIVF